MTKTQELAALKKIRGDWGMVKPVMRIEKPKNKYCRKVKHKKPYNCEI